MRTRSWLTQTQVTVGDIKRSAAARVLWHIPETRPLLESGDLSVSHLAMVAGKITRANYRVILDHIKGKSLRDIKLFLSRVTPDGDLLPVEETLELKLTLTTLQVGLLERAREVLAADGQVPSDAEILVKALDDLLTKRDPLCKAERAAARHGSASKTSPTPLVNSNLAAAGQRSEEQTAKDKSRYIPAQVRHDVWRRDNGRCTHNFSDGSRCTERMMLELDHRTLFCRGGEHSVDNLQLKCRYHNGFVAAEALGDKWYDQRRQH